jgi:hypothetical protein
MWLLLVPRTCTSIVQRCCSILLIFGRRSDIFFCHITGLKDSSTSKAVTNLLMCQDSAATGDREIPRQDARRASQGFLPAHQGGAGHIRKEKAGRVL